jgi:hypothetical protein
VPVKTNWDLCHACGHCEDHDLSAKRPSERAGYARWLGTKDCSGCWRSKRDGQVARERDEWLAERRTKELAETEDWEARTGMPTLEGSDKAVEWARRVRYQLLGAAYETLGLSEEEFAERIETPARHIGSASWWIDQRDAEVTDDMEELVVDAASDDVARASENPY